MLSSLQLNLFLHNAKWLRSVLFAVLERRVASSGCGPQVRRCGRGGLGSSAPPPSPHHTHRRQPASSSKATISVGDEHGEHPAGQPTCRYVNTLRAPGAARSAWRRRSMSRGATPWRPLLLLALLTRPILGYGNIGEKTPLHQILSLHHLRVFVLPFKTLQISAACLV